MLFDEFDKAFLKRNDLRAVVQELMDEYIASTRQDYISRGLVAPIGSLKATRV